MEPLVFQYFIKLNLGFFLNFNFWHSWGLKGYNLPIKMWFKLSDTMQLFTASNFIGPVHHTALLFSGLEPILFFSQPIREDLVKAAYCPQTLESLDRILNCNHSSESYLMVSGDTDIVKNVSYFFSISIISFSFLVLLRVHLVHHLLYFLKNC